MERRDRSPTRGSSARRGWSHLLVRVAKQDLRREAFSFGVRSAPAQPGRRLECASRTMMLSPLLWSRLMTDALILSAVRTPIGKYLGALSDVPAPQLGAVAIREALKRAGAPADRIDEVIVGNVLQAGLGQNPARQAALKAGLPDPFAAQSQQRAAAAAEKGLFKAEIVPVTVGSGPKAKTVDRDESIRAETTREGLGKLKAAFREGGSVTAGNASTLSDGGAAVV